MRTTPLTEYRRGTKPTPGHNHITPPAPASDHLTLPEGVTISQTALVCAEQLTIEDWTAVGQTLGQMEQSLQWWVGDWWHFGYHRYGERKAVVTAKGVFKHAYQTLMNWGSVAGRVETSRRRENLSWSHHELIAKFQPNDQERWLDLAVRNGWKVRQLDLKIKEDEFDRLKASGEYDGQWYLRRLDKLARSYRSVFLSPPWMSTGFADYLATRHPDQLAELIEAVEKAVNFWSKMLEFLRAVQAKTKTNDDHRRRRSTFYNEKVAGPVNGVTIITSQVINRTEVRR